MAKHDISDEDKALFRQAIGGMAPLTSQKKLDPPQGRTEKRIIVRPEALDTELFYLSNSFSTHLTGETPLFYCQNTLEKNHLHQFKRGQLKIEAQLDLHGCTADEAKLSLIRFIQSHSQQNHRSLLVVHGKGKHGGGALLKNLVNHWLPQFPEVLAFVSAQPQDGGTGAVYVLLKRIRDKRGGS